MTDQKRFKVVLVGDGGVGKTTFMNRHLTGHFTTGYVPTLGVDVHHLTFQTNYGPIVFDVWDCAGQEKYSGLQDGYAVGAQAMIGFFDVTSKTTYDNLGHWAKYKKSSIPTVVCGNKWDLKDHKVGSAQKYALLDTWDVYFDVSAKSNYNYEKPFLSLARVLTGHSDLEFVTFADKRGLNTCEQDQPGHPVKRARLSGGLN